MIFSTRCFLQKAKERILLYYYETSGPLIFFCFLEEIEDIRETFCNYVTFITRDHNKDLSTDILISKGDGVMSDLKIFGDIYVHQKYMLFTRLLEGQLLHSCNKIW